MSPDDRDVLLYLYGVVPSRTAAPPADLRGIDDGGITLLTSGEVAAVVSTVPADAYSDEALNSRLDDLAWVGERGLAHERVLDWFSERGPIIPLSLFSLHRDEDRVRRRVEGEASALARALERLRGRKEWGIKLWRREKEAREGIEQWSASLGELAREIAEAPVGKRFLLEKKREAMRAEEMRAVSKRLAHDLFAALRGAADAGANIPIVAGTPGADRSLLLHSAFLVPDAGFTAFQAAVSEQAGRITGSGFELEFTGPWPPYHFSATDDD